MLFSIKKLLHMFFYDIKIHHKIIIFTILIASVPILLMSYIFYNKSEQIIYSEVSSSYKQMLNQYIDSINYKMNLYSTLLDNITYSSIIQDTSLTNESQDYSVYMDIINKVDNEVNSLIYSKKQDETYNITIYPYDTSVTYYQKHIGNLRSVENTVWYKKFILKKLNYNIGVSNTFNPDINTITLIRTIPSLKFQSFLDVYADMIFKIDEDSLDAKNKYLYILDNNNNVVYSSDIEVKINNKIAGFNNNDDLDTSKQYVSLNGRKGILVYKNIDPFGWKAVLFHDNSQIEKKLTDAKLLILITDVVICAILIFLALIFSNTISKRLKMLTNKMKEVMSGDLEIKYKINGKDEIGVLDDDFNNMINRLNKLVNENYVQKIEKREAQLNSLQAQLNPHFLYNTLESINSIASVYNCIEICNISQKLGEMFRYNINSGKSEFVTVKDEIFHIKNYEYIQKIRFDDKFEIIYDIPEAIYNCDVLKFILQPIVENCIIHGFKGNKDILHIKISAYLDNLTLVIDVTDDGIGMNEERLEYLITYINEKDDNIMVNKKKSIGMKNVDSRLKLCFGDEYGIVESRIYKNVGVLSMEAWVTKEPVSFEERTSGRKISLKVDETWGKLWDCAWFNFKGIVPDEAATENVVLLIDINGEACIFDEGGCPIQGLTNINSEFDFTLGKPGKRVVNFLSKAKGGETINLWADAGCNDLFGNCEDSGKIKEAHIAIFNEELKELYYDIEVLKELMEQLPENSARHQKILFSLVEALKVMKNYSNTEVKKARKLLALELNKKAGDESLRVSAIGHAHIDLAWLWPLRETMRKGARTFSTVLSNMEKYPDYVFGASQPQLYAWMKEKYPKLYDKIKEKIAEGRWEAQGGMWVEADTNVPSGEALVRQLLYGQKFFREEFGKNMKVLWLPDVFGYSAALPQILKKADIDYFMTIKLSWSEYNQFPHHTFLWEGIDGSQILAHMPPEGSYNSSAAPRAIATAEKNFKDKGVSEECLMLFGIGDGGGGPGEEHLERLKREKNLNGLLPVKQEQSIDFFNRIGKDTSKYKTWRGELYLEKHQGTYTTQAKNKKFNRKMELALRELEYASVIAWMKSKKEYPQSEIEIIWKEVLLYQFHDILTGSSIKRVYDESLERYEYLLKQTEELTQRAYKSYFGENHKNSEAAIDTLPKATGGVSIINSLSWERKEWLNINDNWANVTVHSMSEKQLLITNIKECKFKVFIEDNEIENDILKVTFNDDGSLNSVFDKEFSRETLSAPGNIMTVYDEVGGDAWDFSPVCYEIPQEGFKLKSSKASLKGPKAIIKQTYEYNDSILEQEIILTQGSRRVDFITRVDWKESGRMLRTSFPVNIYTNEVTCDIQFGNVKRSNNDNTSWDIAKYEICAHKYVDLSENNYGVALLNDCKYGYRVKGNMLDLNLLRSTSSPGIEADLGVHEFTYSLYPHNKNYIEGRVVQTSYELNVPLKVISSNKIHLNEAKTSFINVDNENIIIEAVKKAEYSDDIIVRLYECSGSSVKTNINFGFEVKDVQIVNLLEDAVDSLQFNRDSMELRFKPFEIHTLKITTKM